MDDSKLVSTPSSAARGQTDFITAERHSLVPASQFNPPSHERSCSSGRVEVIWKSLGDRGYSDEAARLITSSWTSGTDKQYNSAWKQWCSWCTQRKIDTLQPPVNEVANFLSKCFADGKSYSTINSYRSALSSSLYPINNTTIGSHPLISRLLKGMYNVRTPIPRYSTTWDVTKVTTYLATLFPLDQLSLKSLTFKTVMLCALSSTQREQTLCALDLKNRRESGTCLSFVITERLKTSKPGKSTEVTFECLPDRPQICTKCTVMEYILRTAAYRCTDPNLCVSRAIVYILCPAS